MLSLKKLFIVKIVFFLGLLGQSVGAKMPETKLKFVGFTSNNVLYKDLEVPFFSKVLPEMSVVR